jgi:glycine oxidase
MNTSNKIDYLIVGQGIAGSTLAFKLLLQNKRIIIIDADKKTTSSKIAAGLINPITGRRLVKTWLWDTIFPFAKTYYQSVEQFLDIKIWKEHILKKNIESFEEENQLALRLGMEDYKNLLSIDVNHYFIHNIAQVDIEKYLVQVKYYCIANESYLQENFDYNQLIINENDTINYKNIEAKNIIFCEGINAMHNPFFQYLPFNPDKGERLILKIPNQDQNYILKNKMAIIPLDKDTFWVGATNSFDFREEYPTDKAKNEILKNIENLVPVDFEIINHDAAVRPTVKDRRPLLGRHPKYKNLIICNGFGTKGTSLIPYFADMLLNHLELNTPLNKEVDISRIQ